MHDPGDLMKYYDRDGNEISYDETDWSIEGRVVEQTEIGEVSVSTVHLVIDHRFFGQGPPLIFESMVFGGHLNGEQLRYSTEQEARAGHKELVYRVKEES